MTNYEVLQALRSYAVHRSSTTTNEDPSKVSLENRVRDYLNSTPIKTLTRPNLEALKQTLEQFTPCNGEKLSRLEIMQVINTLPSTEVELFRIISNIEKRLNEGEIQQILGCIQQYRT